METHHLVIFGTPAIEKIERARFEARQRLRTKCASLPQEEAERLEFQIYLDPVKEYAADWFEVWAQEAAFALRQVPAKLEDYLEAVVNEIVAAILPNRSLNAVPWTGQPGCVISHELGSERYFVADSPESKSYKPAPPEIEAIYALHGDWEYAFGDTIAGRLIRLPFANRPVEAELSAFLRKRLTAWQQIAKSEAPHSPVPGMETEQRRMYSRYRERSEAAGAILTLEAVAGKVGHTDPTQLKRFLAGKLSRGSKADRAYRQLFGG